MYKAALLLLLLLLVSATSSMAISSPYVISADSVYRHISVLADDSFEGREVGEPGELKAAAYIESVFRAAGLQPGVAPDGWMQPFDFIKRIDLSENNCLIVNGVELEPKEEFKPLRMSASAEFEFDEVVFAEFGIEAPGGPGGGYNDYEGLDVAGKAVVVKRFSPAAETNPHVDFDKHNSLTDKINAALDHNAAAVIFITPEDRDDTLKQGMVGFIHPKDIPVIHLRRKGLEKLGLSLSRPEIESISGQTELIRTRDTGYNVIGYLPAVSDTTVIIGAHYDHLGWGTSASLYRGEEKMIHNGADDNASGVSAMMELARFYSSTRDNLHYSLLFIAFSGEEAGVLGSGNYVRNMTIDQTNLRMMLNLDMIGRLKDQEKGLAVMGAGTSTELAEYFDSLAYDDIKLALKQSGSGPSDHAPFYNRGIPAMTFFTGPHMDYHKPSDDIEMIDPEGIVRVTEIARDLIDHFDGICGPLKFQKTKDPGAGKRRSQFTVSLGIMPDYVAEVKGLRVDGVTPDRPGEKAGLLEGDVIVRMGEIAIGDIYDYMNALGKFNKGDTTVIVVERTTDTLNLEVIF